MQRLLIIYNPRSSHYKDVKKEVLEVVSTLKGYMVGKFEVQKGQIEDNIDNFAKVVRDGDLVLSVGGDATGVIAVNGIMKSGKDATLSVLPYGNFNDLARTLGTKKLDEVLNGKTINYWPLEILVDGKHFRYATCYVTIGMTAEAVELFDDEKVRKNLQKGGRFTSIKSYFALAGWYFKNRHKKAFIPEFKFNGTLMSKKTTDYAAVNGRSMAKVMKGNDWFLSKVNFRSELGELANLWNLSVLMCKSIAKETPGETTSGDVLEFVRPATVEMQAEGEYRIFENIEKIEIRKAEICLKMIQN